MPIIEPTEESLRQVALSLAAGELAGLPTETVYGLAANAWDPAAVRRIFEVKGRPAENPLIVHVASRERLGEAMQWPPSPEVRRRLDQLADLWPGPLTVVAPKAERIPAEVTAGRATVAVRIPDHPVALQLLQRCPFPLAAPSANRSNYVSPTTAEHVRRELGELIPWILDGGPCRCGVESTIVAVDVDPPRLLRPGAVTAEELAERFGIPLPTLLRSSAERVLEAPGMSDRHYSPRTPLHLAGQWPAPPWPGRVGRLRWSGVATGDAPSGVEPQEFAAVEILSWQGDPEEAARRLFAALRRLDDANLDMILADSCPEAGLGRAVMDRLQRARYR